MITSHCCAVSLSSHLVNCVLHNLAIFKEIMAESTAELRINIKFCAKLGKSPSETLIMLSQVYGDACRKTSTVFEWHKRFKEGREDVHDDDRSGRPVTHRTEETVDSVRALVKSDRRLSIRMMADELLPSRETVRKILTEDLRMRKISAKISVFVSFWRASRFPFLNILPSHLTSHHAIFGCFLNSKLH